MTHVLTLLFVNATIRFFTLLFVAVGAAIVGYFIGAERERERIERRIREQFLQKYD